MRLLIALISFFALANAQFGFFDQMFGGGGGGGGGGHHQEQRSQNNPSDARFYQHHYTHSACDKYLCPDTLACVHFPHHCPCAWDAHDDKFELAEGKRACVSKGGFKQGEAARKIELARKGLL
ncbi:long chronological lifespan 2 [Trichoderma arundinaceum]|uniref:Long chronological lifespan protein 2 n=1 Tax=Trichoderma arundinaceum TaxID=490622 RepID=A0A395NQV5_TRIAR|nr:long chronological lifespan 2 [Trichoderma arundinaceum]